MHFPVRGKSAKTLGKLEWTTIAHENSLIKVWKVFFRNTKKTEVDSELLAVTFIIDNISFLNTFQSTQQCLSNSKNLILEYCCWRQEILLHKLIWFCTSFCDNFLK